MSEPDFHQQFERLTGNPPFPWQVELFKRLRNGPDSIPTRCDIPTGLGKTSVIAIWLLARQATANLPRRLVYVVNRRTVVDQTTDEVERIRENLPKIGRPSDTLAISTLRGQFADNQEWASDPSREAVICGTVDMIGSRLLFSGYGVGFKGKPLHAGFLGRDVLVVHDEAHLEPAFQTLLEHIEDEQANFPHEKGRFRVMELSATARSPDGRPPKPAFKLSPGDHAHPEVMRRVHATKTLTLISEFTGKLGDQLATLALDRFKDSGRAILIFVRLVEDLKLAVERLRKAKFEPEQLTGTMRGREREKLDRSPVFARFLPESNRREGVELATGTVFLVCTSAGEVGVNISADHLVCDLSTFESMAQRFGRVNRFGNNPDSEILVVHPTTFDDKAPNPQREQTLALLQKLNGDANPNALSQLDENARAAAFAPTPVILSATDILFDAWSLTSVRGHMPGRPHVQPYLHGIADWEPPQTKIAWREEVAEITGDLLHEYPPGELLDSYPLKPHELLTDRTDRIFKTLSILKPDSDVPVWIVDDEGGVSIRTLSAIVAGIKDDIADVTLLLPPRAGGLDKKGNFTTDKHDPTTQYDVADEWQDQVGPMRTRIWQQDDDETPRTPRAMKPVQRIAFPDPDDEDSKPQKTWYWFVRVLAADADARSLDSYDLQPHLTDAKEACRRFVADLPLEPELRDAVILATGYHDLGKDRQRWQNGIGNYLYPDTKWAKSGKRLKRGEPSSYRHEFGSTLDVQGKTEFKALSAEMQDLVVHLIAAHHGRGRPHFGSDECLDDGHDPQAIHELGVETPRRFARLQRKYGRWGLAYLESLVRAADYEASRKVEGGAK